MQAATGSAGTWERRCSIPLGEKCWLGTETRINRNWAQSNFLVADSNSYYHGLQLQLRKRFSDGLQFQSSYTFAKALDETQGIVDAENTTSHFASTDPFDRLRDRGPSSFDLRHNWSLNTIYRLPQSSTGGVRGGFLNGWWVSGILRMRSGYPFTPVLGDDRSRSAVLGGVAGLDRPDLVPGHEGVGHHERHVARLRSHPRGDAGGDAGFSGSTPARSRFSPRDFWGRPDETSCEVLA